MKSYKNLWDEFISDENYYLAVKNATKHKRGKKSKYRRAKYIKEHNGLDVDPNSIFDIQVKRLHAYKRQMLNVLHIIYLYNRIKNDPSFKPNPRTFIFGAKAAPSYYFAKKVIEFNEFLENETTEASSLFFNQETSPKASA